MTPKTEKEVLAALAKAHRTLRMLMRNPGPLKSASLDVDEARRACLAALNRSYYDNKLGSLIDQCTIEEARICWDAITDLEELP